MLFYEDGTWGLTTFGVGKVDTAAELRRDVRARRRGPARITSRRDPRRPNPSATWRFTGIRPAGGAATTSWTASRRASSPFGDAVVSFNPTYGQGMTMTSHPGRQPARRARLRAPDLAGELAPGDGEDDVSGVDDERDRRPGPARRRRADAVVVPPGGRRCSTSSSAPRRPIPFSRNGFCAGSACSTASTWCRHRGSSAGRSGTTCGCGGRAAAHALALQRAIEIGLQVDDLGRGHRGPHGRLGGVDRARPPWPGRVGGATRSWRRPAAPPGPRYCVRRWISAVDVLGLLERRRDRRRTRRRWRPRRSAGCASRPSG